MNGKAKTGNDVGGLRLGSLLGNLRDHAQDLLRREFNLLKTELTEKFACLGRQGLYVAAGGIVAYTGAIFLLMGVCALIAFGIQAAGLSLLMAWCLAFLGLGALVAGIGVYYLKSGLSMISESSLAPEQTLHTVREMRDPETLGARAHLKPAGESDSDKTDAARAAAERKIEQVHTELAEVRSRLTPHYMWAATRTAVSRRPRLSASVGAGLAALGYAFLRRRHRRVATI